MALSTGNETLSLLLEKNPELFFLLEYGEREARACQEMAREECRKRVQSLDLDQLSTLYIYGISVAYYEELFLWLNKKKERRLIFLIHDLASLQLFVQASKASLVIGHPQVVLFHFVNQEAAIQELVSRFPCNLVEILSANAAQDSFIESLRLELLRKSTLAHAIFAETLHSPKLLHNTLANLSFWDRSFLANQWKGKFAGVPAMICGAGPSLQQEIPHLQTLSDRALLLAGGSTITSLSRQGVSPHLSFAIDPNREEFERLKEASVFCEPLLYGTRLEKDVLPCFSGELGYIVSDTGGPAERYFEGALGIDADPIGPELGMEALSVTTLALAFAVHMGCDPILFCGVDLAYTGGKRYAPEVLGAQTEPVKDCDMRAAERWVVKEDIHKQPVQTLVKWVMESECIGAFAANMPHTRFINVSQGGLGFPGIENKKLEDLMQTDLLSSYDLEARIHAEIQESLWKISQEQVAEELSKMASSLTRLSKLMDDIVSELHRLQEGAYEFPSAKFLFLQMEAQEEIAFSSLNPYVEAVLDRLMERWFVPGELDRETNAALAKYKAWQKLIHAQTALFSAALQRTT